MYDITGSIVVYKNDIEFLKKAINSFLETKLVIKLCVVDNSPSEKTEGVCKDERVEYIPNKKNLGFGKAHNIAIKRFMGQAKYHLILNPDVCFEHGNLEKCHDFMERNKEIGLLMPKVCYFDGRVQHLCKLLPTPFDLILRRAGLKILEDLFKNGFDRYMLRFAGHDNIIDAPHLSGCFMLIRQDVFKKAGVFDERFFMYLEDVDLSRRIHKYCRTVYYPEAVIYHKHARHSYSDFNALKHHMSSAIKYFNKWGWFFDEERDRINRMTLGMLKTLFTP